MTVYICCPRCRGVLDVYTGLDEAAAGIMVANAKPFKGYVQGDGARQIFPVGHKLLPTCPYDHDSYANQTGA